MIKMRNLSRLILGAALSLSACNSLTPSDLIANRPANFTNDPNKPKIFFYATYVNPADQPTFDGTFVLQIDHNNIEDINPDQFIETSFPAGNHIFDVDIIAWSGNTVGHTEANIYIDPTKPNFVSEDILTRDEAVLPKDRAVLSPVSLARGEKDVLARTRRCLCPNGLRQIIESF